MVSQEYPRDNGRGHGGGPQSQGNGRERLQVTSGLVVVIDQFMLGNGQFLERVRGLSLEGDQDAIRTSIEMYGGCLLKLPVGDYEVLRDPEQTIIAVKPMPSEGNVAEASEESEAEATGSILEDVMEAKGNLAPSHRVFVDTRCVVFVDAQLLTQSERLSQYRALRERGDEKQARDFIREYGGAVRYGFNRFGDELGVFKLPDEQTVALWPDVVE